MRLSDVDDYIEDLLLYIEALENEIDRLKAEKRDKVDEDLCSAQSETAFILKGLLGLTPGEET